MINNLVLFFLFFAYFVKAQVGDEITNPSGAIKISSSSNGLIIPCVDLSDINKVFPVVNPSGGPLINGTLLWNTSNVSDNLKPGYYYWFINEWIRLGSKTKAIEALGTSSLIEPNTSIPGPLSPLTSFSNSNSLSFDGKVETKNIIVSGLKGNIGQIMCNVKFSHTFPFDAELYLESPTGQIIELISSNGGYLPANVDVTFSESGILNIVSWLTGDVNGVFNPKGTLEVKSSFVPNISKMSDFHGFSPNGIWKLRMNDIFFNNSFNFQCVTLSFKTYGTSNYKLVGETSFVYSSNTKVFANATYTANCVDDEGIISVLSLNTNTIDIGTISASVPGSIMSFASDSPNKGSGNYWVSTHNQAIKNALIDGNTYYIQLWVKGNIEKPFASNQIYSIIPFVLEE